jgi:hypothetical protein
MSLRHPTRRHFKILFVCLAIAILPRAFGKAKPNPYDGPPILCPSLPKDSRAETVYKNQTPDEKNQPVVAGKLVLPRPIKLEQPTFPQSRFGAKWKEVMVEGVIAQNGDFIDGKAPGTAEPDLAKSAVESLVRSRFRPGTLDGKPIAFFTQIVIRLRND